MNLLSTARAVLNQDFQSRVKAAMVVTAMDLQNDSAMEIGSRKSYAVEIVLHDPESNAYITRFLWLTAANAAIADSVTSTGTVEATDSDIHFVVAGLWTFLFGDGKRPTSE